MGGMPVVTIWGPQHPPFERLTALSLERALFLKKQSQTLQVYIQGISSDGMMTLKIKVRKADLRWAVLEPAARIGGPIRSPL